jgi:hypothetical protein
MVIAEIGQFMTGSAAAALQQPASRYDHLLSRTKFPLSGWRMLERNPWIVPGADVVPKVIITSINFAHGLPRSMA